MIQVEMTPNGGLIIVGNEQDLLSFAAYSSAAAKEGEAEAAFISDKALTSILFKRVGET